MAHFQKSNKWMRWRGSSDDIVAIAQQAVELVKSETGTEPTCHITQSRATLDTQFDGIEDFVRNVSPEDLKELQRLVVTVGDSTVPTSPSIAVTFSRGSGEPAVLSLTRSNDRDLAERAALRDKIERGRRSLRVGDNIVGLVAAALLIFLVLPVVQVLALDLSLPDLNPFLIVVGFTIVFGIGGFLFVWGIGRLVGWIVPVLELTAPGEKTRWERSRTKVVAGVGTIVAGLIAIAAQQAIFGRQ